MLKCCIFGAKEDVEEAKKERAKRDQKQKDQKQSNPPSGGGNDGARSGTAITSGRDDIGPPALVKGKSLDGGQNVSSGA